MVCAMRSIPERASEAAIRRILQGRFTYTGWSVPDSKRYGHCGRVPRSFQHVHQVIQQHTTGQLEKVQLLSLSDGLGTTAYIQLAKDVSGMDLDRGNRKAQLLRDLGVG